MAPTWPPDGSAFELPCGGRIQLLVERLEGDAASADLDEWLTRLQGASPFVREVLLEQGKRTYLDEETTDPSEQEEPGRLRLSYAQRWRLLLLGISQVSEQVARLGQAAGFEVRLCDTREPYRRDWHWGPEQGGIAVEWVRSRALRRAPCHGPERRAGTGPRPQDRRCRADGGARIRRLLPRCHGLGRTSAPVGWSGCSELPRRVRSSLRGSTPP